MFKDGKAVTQISGVFYLQKTTIMICGFLQFPVKVVWVVDGIYWISKWKETRHCIPT